MTQHPRLLLAATAALIVIGASACSKPAEVSAGGSTPSSPAANVSDIDITQHVKTALLQTESLKGKDIAVVTLNGDVRLTGLVDSQAQIDEAIRIARAAEGAHTIHDELTIKK